MKNIIKQISYEPKSWEDTVCGDVVRIRSLHPLTGNLVGLLLDKIYTGSSWDYDKFAVLCEGTIKHYNRHELCPLK